MSTDAFEAITPIGCDPHVYNLKISCSFMIIVIIFEHMFEIHYNVMNAHLNIIYLHIRYTLIPRII